MAPVQIKRFSLKEALAKVNAAEKATVKKANMVKSPEQMAKTAEILKELPELVPLWIFPNRIKN